MSNTIAKNIKFYRKQCKMSQRALAEKSGVSLMSIRRYETEGDSNREPTIPILEKIATALNVSLSQILESRFVLEIPKETPELIQEREQEERELHYINTIAAHFEGETLTEEELQEIGKFIEFVKAKRK